jgi:glycosyltransferase involved in cell wall biosynthesis
MRLLHVIPTLSPKYGGPTKVCLEVSRRLAMAGHEVVVFTTNADYPTGVLRSPGTVQQNGVVISYFPVQGSKLLVSWQMAIALAREMPGFDLVHIHGLYRFPLAAAGLSARICNVPYIVRPHGSLDPFQRGRAKFLKNLYERLIEFPNLNRCAAIQYTTQEERRLAEIYNFRGPGVVIPNGIELDAFEQPPEPGVFRERFGLRQQKIIMHLGRIAPVKGLDILVAAFAGIARERDDVTLAIVGPDINGHADRLRSELGRLGILDRTLFTGMLVDEEKHAALRDADIFALPSYTENFGMAVVEAMAAGLPVVISDQVKICKEVQAAGAGLVTPCQSREIERALRLLLDDPAERTRLSAAGKRLVRTFDWSAILHQLLTLYGQLTGEKPSADNSSDSQDGNEPSWMSLPGQPPAGRERR